MRTSRFSDAQVIAILREQEAGRPTTEVYRRRAEDDPRRFNFRAALDLPPANSSSLS